MTLKSKLMMFTAALALSTGIAQAAITADDILQSYKDGGFSAIEVRETATTVKVEAVKDGVKLELVYDKASGDVIKRQQRAIGADGTVIGDHQSGSHDGIDDDEDDHHGSGSDDDDDHDHGDDHGGDSGHDGDDDHGGHDGGHDGGGDDDSGDDN